MGKVISGLTMSLDGFIAAPNDGPENPLGENGMRLFDWYQSGDTDYVVPSGGMTFKVSPQSGEMLREAVLLDSGDRDRTADVRHHEWLGREASPRRTGLRPDPLRPQRMGLRGIPVHLRHGRYRERGRPGQGGGG
jgi:hypothetical protein